MKKVKQIRAFRNEITDRDFLIFRLNHENLEP